VGKRNAIVGGPQGRNLGGDEYSGSAIGSCNYMKNKQMDEVAPTVINLEKILVATNKNAAPSAAFHFGRNCFMTVPKANL
jgi:hypothetical protein